MTLYEMLEEKFKIQNAYGKWEDYRNALTSLILEELSGIQKVKNGAVSILILGAGPCNDISLSELVKAGADITLLDQNREAMETALSKEECRAKLCVETLTGIEKEDVERFSDSLLQYIQSEAGSGNLTREHFYQTSKKLLHRLLFQQRDLPNCISRKKYDMILAVGLASQLYSMVLMLWDTIRANAEEQIFSTQKTEPEKSAAQREEILDLFRLANNTFVPRLTEQIIEAAEYTAIFGNEENLESPVEGAFQCIETVAKRRNVKEKRLDWEFDADSGKRYRMRFQITGAGACNNQKNKII